MPLVMLADWLITPPAARLRLRQGMLWLSFPLRLDRLHHRPRRHRQPLSVPIPRSGERWLRKRHGVLPRDSRREWSWSVPSWWCSPTQPEAATRRRQRDHAVAVVNPPPLLLPSRPRATRSRSIPTAPALISRLTKALVEDRLHHVEPHQVGEFERSHRPTERVAHREDRTPRRRCSRPPRGASPPGWR